MLKNRIKKSIGILTMACFLATPIGLCHKCKYNGGCSAPSPRHGRHR